MGSTHSSRGLAASGEARQQEKKKKKKKKMKTPSERRRNAPSLLLDRALQKRPDTKKSPSTSVSPSTFTCSDRTLVMEGRVALRRGRQRQERHLFLFTDLLIVAKRKCNNNLKIKYKAKLSDTWTSDCVDEVGKGTTDATNSFVLGWPTVNFVATFSSPEEKDKWLSLLQRYINLEKEKDSPKSLPIKIYVKDIKTYVHFKTIIITNSDTTNEVINMYLPFLGITGSEKDYQLWVNSGREKAPYQLIGHESPYAIKMSHLRDTELLTEGPEESDDPLHPYEPFLLEELPRQMRCQFTLRPSHLAVAPRLSYMACFLPTDSSCDSLDKELNEDVDAPCSDLEKDCDQGSRIMDSVLTLSDYDLDQPEAEGPLNSCDSEVECSKHEDIEMEQPVESTPVNFTAVYREASPHDHSGAQSGMNTPNNLSRSSADAPQSPRKWRHYSEPSITNRESKLSSLMHFYRKKLWKSSCDAIFSHKHEDHAKQNQTLQEQGAGRETSKRRRSIIHWPFGWHSNSHLENLPVSPASPKPEQIFGVPLLSICKNENLPKPLMDMLFLLNENGPLTYGIFRVSGNIRSCRELKEKLNSGLEVQLDCESTCVIASVFKDFLRNIPGCILSSDLCNQWVSVMDKENYEQKINSIQRLLGELPRANILLLRYLFVILRNIEQQSSSNQMTAYNLAVCMAPNILWPSTSSGPELIHEFTEKIIQLVQFLIENPCQIFGQEITSLFGEVSVRCDSRQSTTDMACFLPTDSSCDGLDKELNEDVDAPCSDLEKDCDQGSRIMDSVLTLSDYDLDQPEVEGPLTLCDSEVECSRHEDTEMEQPLESTPVNATALTREASPEDRGVASSGTNTPSDLSTAAADDPQSLKGHQGCMEPSINY